MDKERVSVSDYVADRENWKVEYPALEKEYIDTYPLSFGEIDPNEIWTRDCLNLYVHIPFCKTICSFCAFNHSRFEQSKANRYLKALLKELDIYSKFPYIKERSIVTVYFGGGTPTSFASAKLRELIMALFGQFHVTEDAEITFEVHPLTIDTQKLTTLLTNRVNRISLGVQSFNNKLLKNVYLPQQESDNVQAVSLVKKGSNSLMVNIDLMFRLPGETMKDWEEDLEKALDLKPDSLSCYSLDIYPGTPLSERSPSQPQERIANDMYYRAVEILTKNGYVQYTKSDFALPGKECRYILNAWKAPQSEMIGFGAGAFSYIVNDYIYCNIADHEEYVKQIFQNTFPVLMGKKITTKEKMSKYLVIGVRCLRIDKKPFEQLYGFRIEEVFGEVIKDLEGKGLIETREDTIFVTDKGKIYVDNIAKAFYTEENERKHRPMGIELQRVYPQKYYSFR